MSSWYKIYGQYMAPPDPASPDLPTPAQEVYQSAMSATQAAVEGGYALPPGLGNKQAAEASLGVPGADYPHPWTLEEAAQYRHSQGEYGERQQGQAEYGQDLGSRFPTYVTDSNLCGPAYSKWGKAHPLLGYASSVGLSAGAGSLVGVWQRFLGHKGYDLGAGCVDFMYGPKTKAATQKFQQDNSVPVSTDGYATPATITKAVQLGLGCPPMNEPLSSSERGLACGGAAPSYEHPPPSTPTNGGLVTDTTPGGMTTGTSAAAVKKGEEGLLTALSAKAMTVQGALVVGGVALLGVGLFAWARSRQGAVPAMANRYYGEGW